MGNQTNHYKNKRYKREKFIKEYLYGNGNVVDRFVINRNHPNGEEIHEVRDNGIVIVYNAHTLKIVTKIIARPKQLEKLYKSVGRTVPKWLRDLAYWHNSLNYNRV